jgi:MFS family permease
MIWMSLSQTILEMLGLRLFFGFIFGTTIPLGHIVITEIIAANIRGSVMTFIASVFIVGKIYATLLCMLLLDGYESGHWRILVALNSIPLLLCCIGTAFIVRESPRFYLSQKNYQTAFQEIELISLQNGNNT